VLSTHNENLTISLERPGTVEGSVEMPDGRQLPPLAGARVLLQAEAGVSRPEEQAGVEIDPKNTFRLRASSGPHDLKLAGLPEGYYLRDVICNGVPVHNRHGVALGAGAMRWTLKLVLDNRPATLSGEVSEGTSRFPRPYVVLVPSPAEGEDPFARMVTVSGDADGAFTFSGLAPGNYRILAIRDSSRAELDRPHVLEWQLRTAEQIELGDLESKHVSLKLTDLSR
jgi:hypothetical protein